MNDFFSTACARWMATVGAVLAAAAIALAAYTSHAVAVGGRQTLFMASMFAFGHALALTALPGQVRRRLGLMALGLVGVGCLLFSGSLVAAHFLGWPTRLAPAGGILMMLGWLVYAVDTARR